MLTHLNLVIVTMMETGWEIRLYWDSVTRTDLPRVTHYSTEKSNCSAKGWANLMMKDSATAKDWGSGWLSWTARY